MADATVEMSKMKVLVTMGTEVVGPVAVSALLERGHTVRLLSRSAARDAGQWKEGVEPLQGDVNDPNIVRGAAEGCDAVLHLECTLHDLADGAVSEASAHIEGTRLLAEEAARAGARRFVLASSIAAARSHAGGHVVFHEAESIVRAFTGEWVILRLGDVYGPGDASVSLLLKMVRSLPAVPMRGGEEHLQPIWSEDLALALAMSVDKEGIARRALDLAGPERVSEADIVKQLTEITDRSPAKIPVPEFLASLGEQLAKFLNISTPLASDKTAGGHADCLLDDSCENALTEVFGVTPTLLSQGLVKLADTLPEQLPSQGVGAMKRKRFWADIRGCECSADALFERFCARFGDILPIEVGAEHGTPASIAEGATLTLGLPMRGHIQVRVGEVKDRRITLLTLEGHPLAGAVGFAVQDHGDAVRFEIDVCDRAATRVDQFMMRTVGDLIQNANWRQVVKRVVEESGGKALEGVQMEAADLTDDEAKQVESWLEEMVLRRKREAPGPEATRAAS